MKEISDGEAGCCVFIVLTCLTLSTVAIWMIAKALWLLVEQGATP